MATLNEASFTAACLLIVSELIKCKDDLRFQLYSLEQISKGGKTQLPKKGGMDSDSEEEHFVDVDIESEVEVKPVALSKKQKKALNKASQE
jgi:hypothetical protein